MAVNELTWFRCWEPGSIDNTLRLDVASFGRDERPIFIAGTHDLPTKIEGKICTDPVGEILKVLDSDVDPTENCLVPVVGPSGSGKTHLVRTLYASLDLTDERRAVVYVPKIQNTMRGILEQILQALPQGLDSAKRLREALDKNLVSDRDSPEKLKTTFYRALQTELEFAGATPFDPNAADPWTEQELKTREELLGQLNGEIRKDGLSQILDNETVKDHFLRSGGAIDRIIRSLTDERIIDETGSPGFAAEDLDFDDRTAQSGMAPRRQAVLKLAISRKTVTLKILNDVIATAVRKTIGLNDGADVGDVFKEARESLEKDGRELILIFEDLAQMGYLEGAIRDQFRSPPVGEHNSKFALIRAVFAITTGPWEQLQDTVRTFVKLQIDTNTVDFYQSEWLEDAEKLAVRYLNVVRLGKDRILESYENSTSELTSREWVPNKCADFDGNGNPCVHQSVCHETFGDIDGIGLFPYNSDALRSTIRWAGNELRTRYPVGTPRLMIKLVNDFLTHTGRDFDLKSFPDEAETTFDLASQKQSTATILGDIHNSPGVSSIDQRRLKVLRQIWCNEGSEPHAMTEWFNLPTGEFVEPLAENAVGSTDAPGDTPSTNPPPVVNENAAGYGTLVRWEDEQVSLQQPDVVPLREVLFRHTIAKIRSRDLLLDLNLPSGKRFLEGFFSERSFAFRPHDYGDGPPTGHVGFELTESSDLGVLAGALWFEKHGHWVLSDTPYTDWKVGPGEFAKHRTAFESFTDDCARTVMQEITTRIGQIAGPAVDTVSVRVMALKVLGEIRPSMSPSDVLDLALQTYPEYFNRSRYSDEWVGLADDAHSLICDPEFNVDSILAFTQVRQGTGVTQALYCRPLLEACETLMTTTQMSALRAPNAFPERSEKVESFKARLDGSIEGEASLLLEQLASLSKAIPGDVVEALRTGNTAPLEALTEELRYMLRQAHAHQLSPLQEINHEFCLELLRDGLAPPENPQLLAQWIDLHARVNGSLSEEEVFFLQANRRELERCSQVEDLQRFLTDIAETVRNRMQSAREMSDLATHKQAIQALLDTASGYFTKTSKKKENASS
ncbi:MAG: hypothetical protein O3A04_07805 [Actinomycetota bacterium]|nr:hypothetical protein [Actinomycetota bacterium]